MRNGLNLILACVWIVLALLIIGLMVQGINKGTSGFRNIFFLNNNSGRENVIQEYEFDSNGITAVDVDVVSESVSFDTTDESQFKVVITGNSLVENLPKCYVEGNRLVVATEKRTLFNLKVLPSQVRISVPKNATLSVLTGKTVSGSVSVDNQNVERIIIGSTSGSLRVSNSSTTERVEGSTVSGSIRLEGTFPGFNLSSTSGSVRVENGTDIVKDSDVSSVSGSVRLYLRQKSGLQIQYSSVSGSYRNELTNTTGGKRGTDMYKDNSTSLHINTTSGSIRVERL
jgi:DUF4097 and DUF4098 domain-containing protein YvlB